MKNKMSCYNLLGRFRKLPVAVLVGATLTSVSCTTEERIGGQATATGAVLGGVAGALIGGDKNREGGAIIGAVIGGLAGNQVGKKRVRNLQAKQAETDRLADRVASARAFNRDMYAYNQDLNKQITAIVQEREAKRALALAKAKRAEVEQKLRDVDQRLAVHNDPFISSADPNLVPQLNQERRKLQSAVARLKAIERSKGG